MILDLLMENYSKGKNVEEPLERNKIPIANLPENFLWMQVRGGSKIRNLLTHALNELPEVKSVLWTGFGPSVGKAITCAEIMKRECNNSLHQIARLCFRQVEEYWDPLKPELDQIVVKRKLPMIHILLSKDALNTDELGYNIILIKSHYIYQAPDVFIPYRANENNSRNRRLNPYKRQFNKTPTKEFAALKMQGKNTNKQAKQADKSKNLASSGGGGGPLGGNGGLPTKLGGGLQLGGGGLPPGGGGGGNIPGKCGAPLVGGPDPGGPGGGGGMAPGPVGPDHGGGGGIMRGGGGGPLVHWNLEASVEEAAFAGALILLLLGEVEEHQGATEAGMAAEVGEEYQQGMNLEEVQVVEEEDAYSKELEGVGGIIPVIITGGGGGAIDMGIIPIGGSVCEKLMRSVGLRKRVLSSQKSFRCRAMSLAFGVFFEGIRDRYGTVAKILPIHSFYGGVRCLKTCKVNECKAL
ncbi:hypothetical protein NQ318_011830 [Aromia moschata]|uniref:DNA/RNA-binding protein Alba-like domain-containing protein n=1 Tax=Aromia moschata TaxID=1265417 RepID=A0AAV8XQT8_9CUCU|nr:hypothetical protein NQ318_011830 [Aromia moschata]